MFNLDLNEKTGLKSPRGYSRLIDYERAKTTLVKYTGLLSKQIAIFNGSYHALEIIFGSYLKTGSILLLPVPTFPFYQKFEDSRHLKIKKIACVGSADVLLIDKNLNSKINALYLVNPNNPLGYIFNLTNLTKLLKKAAAQKILVVVDEAYYEFSGITSQSLLSRFSNLIIVRTMSKAFGLPGIRIGYILASPKIIMQLEILKGPPYVINHYGLNLISQLRQKDFSQVKKYAVTINYSRVKLTKIFNQAGFKIYPSTANFITIKIINSDKVTIDLAKKGILVTNLNNYPDGGKLLKNHLRITIPYC